MKSSAKSCVTAGVAIMGAGVITASPIAPPPNTFADASHTQEVSLLAHVEAAEDRQALAADLALLEGFDPAAALRAFIEGTIEAFQRPGPVPYTPVTGPLDGLSRIGQGFTASGLRLGAATVLTPLGFVELLPAFAEGNGAQALAALVENIVDGPLWVVDPALYALRDALPAPLGGPGGLIENFRNGIWAATQEINAGLADPAGAIRGFVEGTIEAFQRPGPVAYTPVTGPIDGLSQITQGAIATGLRLVAATVLTPLGFVELLPAFAEGNGAQALAALVENIVDGPLWVADPLLYGLRDALPGPLGGPDAVVENFRNGIWAATQQINDVVRSVLGLSDADALRTADDSAIVAVDKFSGPSATSTLNSRARVVNLPQKDTVKTVSSEDEDDTAKQEEPKDDDVDSLDDPVSETDPKDADDPQPDRNLVRESPNFSPSVTQKSEEKSGGDAEIVEKTPTPPTDADPVPGDEDADGDTPGGSEPADSETPSGDE